MTISTKALIVEKISKDYNFDGKVGRALAIRSLIGTDVFRLKVPQNILDQVEEGKVYTLTVNIRTVKEEPRFEVLDVGK